MDLRKLRSLPSEFRPEEYITVPTHMVKTRTHPLGSTVSGSFASRIHIAPIDCNLFAYGQPGGGGIGFGVSSGNRLTLTLSADFSYEGPQFYLPTVCRAITVASTCLQPETSFQVRLDLSPEVSSHGGLGSNAIIISSILFAANALFDRPLSDDEVRYLVAANFAESNERQMCSPGLETGLASAIVACGGFNLVVDRTHHIWHHSASYMPDVYLARLDIPRRQFSGSEDDIMLARSLREDLDHRGMRSYAVLMELIPAVIEGDLKAIGDIIWRIQFSGTHLSMIQSYGHQGAEIYEFICTARASGIEIVGMSSVGPTFFLVSSDSRRVESFLEGLCVQWYRRSMQTDAIYRGLQVR